MQTDIFRNHDVKLDIGAKRPNGNYDNFIYVGEKKTINTSMNHDIVEYDTICQQHLFVSIYYPSQHYCIKQVNFNDGGTC
jgi:hypothetical protein